MKRAFSLILVLAFLLGMTACGTTADPASVSPNETSAQETTSAQPEETTTEYGTPDLNFNGEKFTILEYVAESESWKMFFYHDILAESDSADPLVEAQFRRNTQVESELNVKLVTLPTGGSNRKAAHDMLYNFIMAGDKTADAAMIFAQNLKDMLAAGDMLVNLHDIDSLRLDASWWDQNEVAEFDLYGKLFCLAGDVSLYRFGSLLGIFFNKDMANELKLPDLYTTARDGKWTFDKMYEYSHTAARDLNGDGVMDKEDSFGLAGRGSNVTYYILASGERFSKRNEKGDVSIALNTQRVAGIIQDMIPFFNDMTTNSVSNKITGYSNAFAEYQMPMFKSNKILFNYQHLLTTIEMRDMDADFGLLPLPKYGDDQAEYYGALNTTFNSMFVVPVTNNRFEITGRVFDALGYYSQQYVTPAYIDQTVRYKTLRDEGAAEMLDVMLANTVYDVAMLYNWGNIQTNIESMGNSNSTDFASTYAGMEASIQAALANTVTALKK